MATLQWQNASQQLIKWLVVVNGQLQGDALQPRQNFTMDSAGVTWAGWSLSGFSGYTFTMTPTPPGFAGVFIASQAFSESEDISSILKQTPAKSGD